MLWTNTPLTVLLNASLSVPSQRVVRKYVIKYIDFILFATKAQSHEGARSEIKTDE
jgi:hypothetical protein